MPDWDACAAFLAGGRAFGAAPEVIETHTARVYLTRDRAWKLRRPVDYGWLDYATRARRRAMAGREVDWNAPAAPGLYLGLGGVADGPRLVAPGEPLPEDAEPLVVMRRFPEDALFDRMAAAGRLDAGLIAATGAAVAALHRASPPQGPGQRLPAFADGEAREMGGLAAVLGAERVARFARLLSAAAERLAPLAAGRAVRRCHGDLHLRNIVLWRGRPAPFDCIEFNDAFSRIDPLYDLAFLAMDLRHRGLAELVLPLVNAWAEAMAAEPGAEVGTAYGGLGLLAFYEACRAGIRAKTGALAAARADAPGAAEARAYADLAIRLLETPPAPRLIAVGGRSGSGKSTLARGLAARLGAVVLRSDAIRKGLAGVAETERLPAGAYTAEASGAVYAAMQARARMALGGGVPVILDAAHLRPDERAAAAGLAAATGVPFAGLWLEGAPAVLRERLAARRDDASDATPAVLERQLGAPVGQLDWPVLEAGGAPGAVLEAALARLGAPAGTDTP